MCCVMVTGGGFSSSDGQCKTLICFFTLVSFMKVFRHETDVFSVSSNISTVFSICSHKDKNFPLTYTSIHKSLILIFHVVELQLNL